MTIERPQDRRKGRAERRSPHTYEAPHTRHISDAVTVVMHLDSRTGTNRRCTTAPVAEPVSAPTMNSDDILTARIQIRRALRIATTLLEGELVDCKKDGSTGRVREIQSELKDIKTAYQWVELFNPPKDSQ